MNFEGCIAKNKENLVSPYKKEARIKKLLDDESYAFFMNLYRYLKKRGDINEIVRFKSIVRRIALAQLERGCNGEKVYVKPLEYFGMFNNETIINQLVYYGTDTPLRIFGFEYRKDYNKLL